MVVWTAKKRSTRSPTIWEQEFQRDFMLDSCLLVWFHGVHFSVVLHVNHAEIMAVNCPTARRPPMKSRADLGSIALGA